jgi:ABC-2 type transport system permease protein
MSTIITNPAITENDTRLHTAKPSFIGLVGGELFKLRKQWSTWIMLIVLVGLNCLPFLIALTLKRVTDSLAADPAHFLGNWIGNNLAIFRVISGLILIIMTARLISQEYNLGTIRILLARGVGRVQLLLAKLTALAIWAIIILLIGLALHTLLIIALVQIETGNINALNKLDSTLWHDVGIHIATIALNMGITILMAAAISALGRSLAFGLSLSLVWFPADNILVGILVLVSRLTNNDAWTNITAYFIGPNLNIMIASITGREWSFGTPPATQTPVDGTHTVVVALVYSVIFAVAAFVLTAKRDVKE